jgi:dipeptide transport system substrate-binding protein
MRSLTGIFSKAASAKPGLKFSPVWGLGLIIGLLVFASSGRAAGTFVYCSEGNPSTFNPQLATDGTTFNAAGRTLYNQLLEFKMGTTELQPSLAESWKVSKDGLNYTFTLRKGVSFHTTPYFTPTREFNADDVLFSFNRQRLKDHPFHKVSGGSYEYFSSM